MKVKILFFLLGCLLVFCGCSEEQLHSTAVDLLTGDTDTTPVPGPPPPEIATLLWGDIDAVRKRLADVIEKGSYEAEDGSIILGGEVTEELFTYEIDFIETQRNYYQKYIDADGIAIIGGREVDDVFFYAARKIVLGMTAKGPEVREWLSVHHRELPSDRFRMILATPSCGIPQVQVSVRGESRLCDRYIGACIPDLYCVVVVQYSLPPHEDELSFSATFIHEMGHAIHYALQDIDPTFQERLVAAYEDTKTGEGGSLFGGLPINEFWTEATKDWFFKVSNPNPFGGWGEYLRRSDPLLYELLDEVYPLLYLRAVDWEHITD